MPPTLPPILPQCKTQMLMDLRGQPFTLQYREDGLFGTIAQSLPGRLQPGSVLFLQVCLFYAHSIEQATGAT